MRRRLGSALLGAYVLALALANLGVGPAERITAGVGLDQAWSVFAPEPLQHEVVFEADVLYADGRRALWRPPRRWALAAPLGYHLEEWTRRVVRDVDWELWRPAARWIARTHTRADRRPVRVTLRRRWRPVPRPGAAAAPGVWQEFDFHTLDLGEHG